ncbi:MAG: glutathione S-transferase family protein [Mangrovicoccus sp.]|nr:glutathione S-transferase family protein [Mangrovicoccus sp.]
MTNPLILHGYASSPFSEKIRLMLGYLDLPWRALIVPSYPPRPSLDPALSGYRRIPVLQIGADYICDTWLIAHELAQRAQRPELSPALCAPDVRAEAEQFDTEIFRAGIMTRPRNRLFWAALRHSGFGLRKLAADRRKMMAAGGFRTMGLGAAETLWRGHLQGLEARLRSGFLGGDQPNAADFSAYHTLWFARDFVGGMDMSAYPNLARWYGQMAGFGHGQMARIKAPEALKIAHGARPQTLAVVSQDAPPLGTQVAISPTDYGRDPTLGRLLQADATRYVIARQSDKLGEIQVHFPRFGFAAEPV